MKPGASEVARALVALPSWRWEAGIAAWDVETTRRGQWRRVRGGWEGREGGWVAGDSMPFEVAPDLIDAATGGVLLGRLAAAGGSTVVSRLTDGRVREGREWCVTTTGALGVRYGSTLGEACARALLALGGA